MRLLWLAACTPGYGLPFLDVVVTDGSHSVLEKRFDVDLPPDWPATLACVSADDPGEVHVRRFAGGGEVRLFGLLADTDYHCALTDHDRRLRWADTVTTGRLPPDMAELVAVGDADRSLIAHGYVVLNHWHLGPAQPRIFRVLVVDAQGRIRWYRALSDARDGSVAAHWTGEHLLVGGGQGQTPSLFDLSGDVAFAVGPPAYADGGYHHEALFTDEGYIVSLADAPILGPQGTLLAGGFRIEATDPASGDVVWAYDTQEGVDRGEYDWVPRDRPDVFHANALLWVTDPDGPAVWVSSRGTSSILRIDRDTGRMTWRMGRDDGDWHAVDAEGRPLGIEAGFFAQHGPELDGHVLRVHDNGAHRADGLYSRAVAYRLNARARTLEPLWDWTEPGWYEPYYGNVDGLTDEHTLVATGHCDHCEHSGGTARRGFVVELDDEGDEVWRLQFADWSHSLYRAEYVAGCDLFANTALCPHGRP